MALDRTLDIARSSLAVVSDRAAVVSRNVAHAGDPGASRKVIHLTTDSGYAPRVAAITRTVSDALQGNVVAATSDAARHEVIVAALDQLETASGDPSSAGSIAGRLDSLRAALQTYSARPADSTIAAGVLSAAKDVAASLRGAAQTVGEVRRQADEDIAAAVTAVNRDLSRLQSLDTKITSATRSGLDVTDDLDERDRIIGRISEQVGLTVSRRTDNGISLYSDSGITLYDGVAREIAVQPRALVPGQPGGVLTIDGVQATGPGSVMTIASGRLAGLFELRDEIAITHGAQLDELARATISAFAESDQGTPGGLPDVAGLFRGAGSNAVPASGALVHGLASSLEVGPSVDPARGGNLMLLRDGGIGDPGNPAYVYNSTAAAGFAGRINQLSDAFSVRRTTDARAELPPSASVVEVAASSTGWLQLQRQSRSERQDYAAAVLEHSLGALERSSGVNIDEQLTELMGLQRAYQASSKLISTVDTMFGSLMQAIR